MSDFEAELDENRITRPMKQGGSKSVWNVVVFRRMSLTTYSTCDVYPFVFRALALHLDLHFV
jgi:hypothetical protein